MDLAVEPDIYEPNINDKGEYIDVLPYSGKFQNGFRCPCGARREHIFDNRQSFSVHIKTKSHQKWLQEMNMNKMNYYSENIKLRETINTQKLIIGQLQKEMDENKQLIVHLSKKMAIKENSQLDIDLMNFD
jgi:hypothetical protein